MREQVDHIQESNRRVSRSLSVSVAMCTYNAGHFLSEQLDSIARQTRLPDEMVISDDGSSDATLDQLNSFALEAPFQVRIIRNQKNLGYSHNFAQALDHCAGDIILLSDQDDRWHETRVRRMEELFRADEHIGGVFTDGDLMDSTSSALHGSLWSSFAFGVEDQRRINSGDAVQVLIRRNVVTGMALAIRDEWREVMKSMPEHWPHDAWLALMLASENQLRACPERLVTYRVHAGQKIGVPSTRQEKLQFLRGRGLGAYLCLSRERNIREYTREAVQFESLLRQAEENPDLHKAWWFPIAQAKAVHARQGANLLNLGRFSRMKKILYRWKDYHRYSPTGMKAFWRDLAV